MGSYSTVILVSEKRIFNTYKSTLTTKRLHNPTRELGHALAAWLELGSLFTELFIYFFSFKIPVVCPTY